MALKVIGTADCPLCDQQAPVGISRDGEGQAIHMLCAPCGVNLQARRSGIVGQRWERAAQEVVVTERRRWGEHR